MEMPQIIAGSFIILIGLIVVGMFFSLIKDLKESK